MIAAPRRTEHPDLLGHRDQTEVCLRRAGGSRRSALHTAGNQARQPDALKERGAILCQSRLRLHRRDALDSGQGKKQP